jgi:hypothetical protein
MKWTKRIAFSLAVVAFSIAEISAQTTSSAAQVVTFGVRRIALQVPTAAAGSNTMNRLSLKVTVGSLARIQSAVELNSAKSSQKFSSEAPALAIRAGNRRPMIAARESDVYASKSLLPNSLPSGSLFVTLTE